MRAWLLLLLLVVTPACATLPPPIVQAWTVVLLHDTTVVHVDTVLELYPVVTWRQCAGVGGFRLATTTRCRTRAFRFVDLDRGRRLATYRELRPAL